MVLGDTVVYTYLGDAEENIYRFVYNDIDRSVKYMKQPVSGIKVEGFKELSDYENVSKLKLLGFYWKYNFLTYDVCEYHIGGFDIILALELEGDGSNCSLALKFFKDGEEDIKIKSKCKYGFVDFDESDNYAINGKLSFCIIPKFELFIPAEMIDYILSLESVHDFDGIMKAFDNLIGKDIGEIADGITGNELKFGEWL